MAETIQQQEEEPPLFPSSSTSFSSMLVLKNLMSKRRTWVFLFLTVYAILLSISSNFLNSVLSWYESTMKLTPTSALYGSMVLGLAFGVLSIVAALIVVVPATLVTWITILVLLTFAGKGRRDLVMEGKKLTGEITGFVVRVLIKEGNLVAVICAVLGYFALVRRNKEDGNDY
ncbi:uncharacterized protein LOC129877351 [Solanum dulcamara]|uniref:uncharacterized protein LOC129877351 n=1 Tax=Solanum dulcamara TaxID=45834 RepID=UPI00248609FE|nr:uncharacterized protein LOC129877351 [Solanum dulcamara]XP_055808819.1 uncharacterized protein LOC129877351 [Solanum dulcamara]XP_055808820.1 uncharacterized protein LOC129877351 [Solanum dulcamara]XP_055808821.1 uncharacterized protein LOC129877351 [Solanum dulcamara]XP_055808822.1 uncharacterized protein LOC129877351 [Solanum dulcamara]XP_055808823.1 uncharacterized protein LOC129877351 [Solanum dulcamara]